jgi:hypothetical protein
MTATDKAQLETDTWIIERESDFAEHDRLCAKYGGGPDAVWPPQSADLPPTARRKEHEVNRLLSILDNLQSVTVGASP